MLKKQYRILTALCLSVLLLVTACAQPESRWDQVQQETKNEQIADTATAEPIAGGEFNKFFPEASGEYDTVYTQEKQGFAEAKLKQNGEDVAMLSISDTALNPDAVTKFQNSELEIAGYPAAEVGNSTAVLVSDRIQVKVQSRGSLFTAEDRASWLEQFNLQGLEELASAS